MATQISNSGRYVMYDVAIDSELNKNSEQIQRFKTEQVSKLLEDSPYDLTRECGRVAAIQATKTKLAEEIEIFSHEAFQQAAKDIAFSIISQTVAKR